MREKTAGFCMLVLLGLNGCDRASGIEDAPKTLIQKPPERVCRDSKNVLEALGERTVFEYDQQGRATTTAAAWLAFDAQARDQIGQALALYAACEANAPSAQRIAVIRSEVGSVLMERAYDTASDFSSLEEQARP